MPQTPNPTPKNQIPSPKWPLAKFAAKIQRGQKWIIFSQLLLWARFRLTKDWFCRNKRPHSRPVPNTIYPFQCFLLTRGHGQCWPENARAGEDAQRWILPRDPRPVHCGVHSGADGAAAHRPHNRHGPGGGPLPPSHPPPPQSPQ